LRQRGDTPVIMVTALAQDIDKLQALRSGADDYVVKPFNPLEVVARAKVVLRRSGHNRKSVMRVGALLIDMDAHTAIAEVSHQRRNLDLTRTEFRLLAHMAQWPNRVFERGELVDACLPEGDAVDRTVDSHISKLRRKLHEAGVDNQLTGVRGVGYRLEDRFV
jgi:two-component system response regulator AdeR